MKRMVVQEDSGTGLCSCKTSIHYVFVNKGCFKSQALLDEAAILSCMVYVDLNPIRAKMAKTPEKSEYTSIQKRIQVLQGPAQNAPNPQPAMLLPFIGNPRKKMPKGLAFCLKDYLELVDWTGRALLENKRGAIDYGTAPILERLNIEPKQWIYLATHFESQFKGLVGSALSLMDACSTLNRSWCHGMSAGRRFFPT